MLRLTPVVRTIIMINVIVFGLLWIAPDLLYYIALCDVRTEYFKPYQLFTYMFVQQDFGHIFWNMVLLFFSGPVLEEYWGQKKFLFFYMAAGLGAAIFYVLIGFFYPSDGLSIMYGASGAVYGVLTAFGIIFAEMPVRLFFVLNVKAKYVVLFLGTMAILNSVGPLRDTEGGVAHLAHLGGIVVAIILILYWRSKGRY